ncbi:unnamed protein product, partial [Effrenium voratum]
SLSAQSRPWWRRSDVRAQIQRLATASTLPMVSSPIRGNERKVMATTDRAGCLKETNLQELSAAEHASIGALVGSLEMAIMRPAVFWKTELQQQRFSLMRAVNPSYCYRGLPLAIASIAPITCIQFGANSAFSTALKELRGSSQLSEGDKILAAVTAGAASALVQCPCQLVEVNQSNHGSSMLSTARRVVSMHGILGLYRGYTMGATREGIFCSSYMAINPMTKRWLQKNHPELSDTAATLCSSAVSGTLGAAMSHPADTLKTRLQAGALPLRPGEAPEASHIRGPIAALKDLQQRGHLLQKCYAGFSPRLFRLICCTYIYSTMTERLEDLWRMASVDFTMTPLPLA